VRRPLLNRGDARALVRRIKYRTAGAACANEFRTPSFQKSEKPGGSGPGSFAFALPAFSNRRGLPLDLSVPMKSSSIWGGASRASHRDKGCSRP
jgi:hypothetical protein